MSECFSCNSISGKQRISPGQVIFDGTYWAVEHAYPTALLGWLVIVSKRHVEALHELTDEEWSELAKLQSKTVRAFREYFSADKEYTACFAEQAGFAHIHFHMMPRTQDVPPELWGSKVFAMLKSATPAEPAKVAAVCQDLQAYFLDAHVNTF